LDDGIDLLELPLADQVGDGVVDAHHLAGQHAPRLVDRQQQRREMMPASTMDSWV
jgi:hypothetical protein